MKIFFRVSFISYFLLHGNFLTGDLVGQPPHDINRFDWTYPVKHPLRLSGTFGELRNNHFHTGIDIKSSSGTTGDPVYTVEDGFIARMNVSSVGYGKVLFIHHPYHGITTTYAHLDRFTPRLDSILLQRQYAERQYEVALKFPMPGLPVKKGDLIGYMGSTGNSSGPHLHFEVRDDSSGIAINPLYFQRPVYDENVPVLRSIRVYYLDAHHRPYKWIDVGRNELKSNASDTLIIPSWRIGFGVETFDPHNDGYNKNGIYRLALNENGQDVFVFSMDSLRFSESNYLNAHIDFNEFQSSGRMIHKTFLQPGNMLSMYRPNIGSGVISIHRQVPKKVELTVSDFNGNTQHQTIWVKRAENVIPPADLIYHYHLSWDKRNVIHRNDITLDFPPGSLYENLYLFFKENPALPGKTLSKVYSIHNPGVAIHKAFQLTISAPQNLIKDRQKIVIGRISKEGAVHAFKTAISDSTCSAKVSRLGDYAIFIDTLGPGITPLSENVYSSGFRFHYKVVDNFSRADGPDFTYEANLDKEWTLAEFDKKSGRLEIKRNNIISGEHSIELIVTDMVGNKTTYKKKFRIQ